MLGDCLPATSNTCGLVPDGDVFPDGCPVFFPVHQNYVGADAEKNPFFLSVVLSDQNNQRVPQYRAILWRKTVRGKLLPLLSVFNIIGCECISFLSSDSDVSYCQWEMLR